MNIRKTWQLIVSEIKNETAYRVNVVIAALSSFLYLFVNVMIWTSISNNSDLDLKAMITYLLLVVLATGFVNDNLQSEFARRVKYGTVSVDLLLPVPFKTRMLVLAFARSFSMFLYSSLPVFLLSLLIWGINPPASLQDLISYLVLQSVGIILGLELNFLLGQLIIRNGRTEPTQFAFWALMTVFGGRFVPVYFYPKLLSGITAFLPFKYLYSVPISVYQGYLDYRKVEMSFVITVIWICLFKILNELVLRKNLKVLSIQGG